MTLGLHNLQPSKGAKKQRKTVGRGNGSGLGTTAGRGTKGQRARSGVSGLKRKGLKMNLTQLPKFRGTKSVKEPVQILNLAVIEKYFENGEEVSMKTLKEKNIISSINRKVKILGVGTLNKKLHFKNFAFSSTAREQIEKAGGTIEGKK